MRRLQDLSIKTKLVLLSGVSAGLALVLSSAGFMLNDVRTMRALKKEELQTQAAMLAFNGAGVLSFHDVAAARNLLASLRSQPAVEYACFYDLSGKVLAAYANQRTPDLQPPKVQDDDCRITDSGHVEVFRHIVDHDEPLGTVYIRANMDDLRRQYSAYAVSVIGVMLAALCAAILLAFRLQGTISEPIFRLAQTAMTVRTAGDYSRRVVRASHDELGNLYSEFNGMMDRIEASEQELQAAHDELEERVVARTAELRAEIAERERTQAELVHAKEAAEAANIAKSRFLANMSHEIRTPLNAILGFTDLLRRGCDDGNEAERRDYLETIHTSGRHLLNLINDILDLSKVEADRLDVEQLPCSPHEIINEVVSVLRVRAIEKGLTLGFRWVGGVPETIRSDPARFRQLLMNLVSNAIKFTHTGGVQILAELTERGGRPQLVIEVVDSGVGIPTEKFEAIFDPFVQADNSVTRQFGGTGLGLTISRRIAEALGGSIRVSSEIGEGSTFTVTIPTGPLEQVRVLDAPLTDGLKQQRPRQDSGPVNLRGVRLLLVEDGETNRKLISLVLRRAGASVISAENGQVGVDLALQAPYDLILMDMQMPVMDGYTAAGKIRHCGIRAPIIALTAHAMKGDEEKCRQAGCSGYVTKPVDADVLLHVIADALADAGTPVVAADAEAPAAGPRKAARHDPLLSTLPTEDPEFREIVEEFIQRLDDQLDTMRRACAAREQKELARLAHWLKGAGGTAGFPALTEPSKYLERSAELGQWEQAEAALRTIADVAERMAVAPTPAV